MNWIEEMIAEQCPNGVEKVKLGELGAFENIGTDKKIVEGEQLVTLLNYVDIYHHKKITPSIPNMVVSANDKKIKSCTVEKGDIFVTPTSETPDDIGHSAVITQSIPNAVYSYHIMRYRQFTHNMTTSYYINYCFDSISVQKQIQKKAQGLTRFGLSKDKFASIEIPLPSLSIQKEIVSVLDKFSELIEKTDEEIALRQKQYEYYREKLLTFEDGEVEEYEIQKCCVTQSGGTPSKRNTSFWENGDIKWLGSTVCQNVSYIDTITDFITAEGLRHSSAKLLHSNTTLIALVGATIGKVAYLTFDSAINQNIVGLYSKDTSVLMNKYIYYYSYLWYKDFMSLANGKLAMASLSFVRQLKIKYPSLSRQQEIVDILDKFEVLISKLKGERELRQKQYEYYREKLLTF